MPPHDCIHGPVNDTEHRPYFKVPDEPWQGDWSAGGVAPNPLTGNDDHIASVLQMLASQEGCDGEPYDQMQAAAEYIRKLESQVDVLFRLSRLVRNTDGLFPSTWGAAAGKLLIKVKASDEERYQKEVMEE